MTFPRDLVIALALLNAPLSTAASANSVYLSQSGGTFSGGSACNGQSTQAYTYFSDSSNWTSGTPTGTQIGPGTTVYICGTITAPQSTTATIFQFQGSGTSGNPITLKWDAGAIVTSPAFHEGVNAVGYNYIVIDGGTNGIIEDSANGIGQSYNQGSQAVNVAGSNITVQNLTIGPTCLRSAGDNFNACQSGSWGGTGITCNPANGTTGCKNILITKNTLIKPGDTGIEYDPYNGDSNVTISYNTISGVDWAFAAVSTGSAFSTTGLYIFGNDFACTVGAACIWDDPGDNWHHNGIILFPGAVGSGITQTMNSVVIHDNYIHDFQSSTSASICGGAPPTGNGCVTGDVFIDPGYSGSLPGLSIYNNVLTSNNSFTGPGNGTIVVGNANSVAYTAFVYNNTSVVCGRDGFSMDYSGSIAKNNIMASCQQYGFWSDVSSTTVTVDYNDYYNGGSGVAATNGGGTTFSTLSSWQSGSTGFCSGGCDAHSITTNPNLTATYMLQANLQPSSGNNNLTSLCTGNLTGLCTGAPQYFGVNYACGTGCIARPSSGAWDMGAYPSSGSSGSGPQAPTGLSATVN